MLVGRYVSMGSMQNTSCKNAGLDEAQVGIRIAGKNINNLRYPDDTTLMAKREEELKSLLSLFSPFKTMTYLCMSVGGWVERDATQFPHSAAAAAAAAAKLHQSCPTLCNPIDGSPPGSPVPGILRARTLEWVAISFSNA